MKKIVIYCFVLFVCLSLCSIVFSQSCSLVKNDGSSVSGEGVLSSEQDVEEVIDENLPEIKPTNLSKEIQTEVTDETIVDEEA